MGRDYGAVVATESSVSGKGLEGGIAGASLQVGNDSYCSRHVNSARLTQETRVQMRLMR